MPIDPDSVIAAAGGEPTEEDKGEKKPAATLLVEIAEEMYSFGISDTGEAFGVPRSGPRVLRMLRGGKTSLRGQLSREYFRRHGKAAAQQALADALLVIEGIAQDSDETELHLRVARHDGALWLDLGDHDGRAVRVTSDGWTVEPQAPVLFRRTALNSPLPVPERGELSELWDWLNVDAEDQPLVAAWLVAALHAEIPHPILSISGEQGTGKSTAEKVLVSVLDPSPVPLRKPPRDADAWVTAAAGSWVVGLDNLSDVTSWLSDSMCRAVTGDGDVRRRLYTDADMAVFSFRRCLILNGIDLGAVRGDLADRLLPIQLATIPDGQRLQETELWPRWERVHPRILGALLDLAASVETASPFVRLDSKPRMADYARVLAAVDHVLGTDGLSRYLTKQNELATDSLTGDAFISAISDVLCGDTFTGSAADLLAKVDAAADEKRPPKGWPSTARQVTTRLRRQAPVMRKAGWHVTEDDGANKRNAVVWTITPPARPRDDRDPDSPNSPNSPSQVRGQKFGESEGGAPPPASSPDSPASQRRARQPSLEATVFAGQDGSGELASQTSQKYAPSQDDAPGTARCCETRQPLTAKCRSCPLLSAVQAATGIPA